MESEQMAKLFHDLKNDFAAMTALTNLHRVYAGKIEPQDLLARIKTRQYVISSAYEKLYRNKNYPYINLKIFIQELLAGIDPNHSEIDSDVIITSEIEEKELPLKKALPMAQIIVELVTNSYRHAFNNINREKRISISLKQENQIIVINYFDNGNGLPEEIIPEKAKTLGMQFIKSLSRQLGGTPVFDRSGEGLKVSLVVNIQEKV